MQRSCLVGIEGPKWTASAKVLKVIPEIRPINIQELYEAAAAVRRLNYLHSWVHSLNCEEHCGVE